jgi:hypothetical protein
MKLPAIASYNVLLLHKNLQNKTFKYIVIHLNKMGTITANIEDTTEELFRKRVYNLYGKRKGNIGKALNEAMLEWIRKKEYFERCMYLLEEGINLGKLKYKNRDELHDRN